LAYLAVKLGVHLKFINKNLLVMKEKTIYFRGSRGARASVLASLDIDPQRGFSELCPNELPVPGALEIVNELDQQAKFVKIRVASKDAHPAKAPWIATDDNPQFTKIAGYPNLDIRWNGHCVSGTEGFEFLPGLYLEKYDFIAYKGIEPSKHPYGACYHDLFDTESTGLIEFLRINGIKTVIVGGLATSFCVKTTVLQLCAANFEVFVNLAACRDIPGVNTAESIKEMENAGAIMLDSSSDIKEK